MDGGLYALMPETELESIARPDDKHLLRSAITRAVNAIAEPGSEKQRLESVKSILMSALDGMLIDPALPNLSPRQRETLVLLAEGLANRLIARRMGVEEDVVKTQIRVLLDRLGLRNRTALALWAVRHGIASA